MRASRRRRRLGLALGIAAAGLVACNGFEGTDPLPSHLILVTLDTVRADHLGVCGYERPTSPNLDAFAAAAVTFTDVTCSMPTTLPSHVSILTGLPPAAHGVRANGEPVADELVSVFERLEDAGFTTHGVLGSLVLRPSALASLGFGDATVGGLAEADAPTQVSGERVTDAALAWLRAHAPGERIALWAHYFDAHEPYSPSLESTEAFAGDYTGDLPNELSTPFLVELNRNPPANEADFQHVVDLYDAELADLDRHLGALFDGLRDLGIWDDSVVVVVADHGQSHGDRGHWGHGAWLTEPIVRVPLLVRLPGGGEGTVVEASVETLDLAPTLADLFDIDLPLEVPGRSLVAALRGQTVASASVRVIERRSYRDDPDRAASALHGGDWKLVYRREDGEESVVLGRGRTALDGPDVYEPGAPEADLLPTLRALADAAAAPGELDEDERRLLESLGYLP